MFFLQDFALLLLAPPGSSQFDYARRFRALSKHSAKIFSPMILRLEFSLLLAKGKNEDRRRKRLYFKEAYRVNPLSDFAQIWTRCR